MDRKAGGQRGNSASFHRLIWKCSLNFISSANRLLTMLLIDVNNSLQTDKTWVRELSYVINLISLEYTKNHCSKNWFWTRVIGLTYSRQDALENIHIMTTYGHYILLMYDNIYASLLTKLVDYNARWDTSYHEISVPNSFNRFVTSRPIS